MIATLSPDRRDQEADLLRLSADGVNAILRSLQTIPEDRGPVDSAKSHLTTAWLKLQSATGRRGH